MEKIRFEYQGIVSEMNADRFVEFLMALCQSVVRDGGDWKTYYHKNFKIVEEA